MRRGEGARHHRLGGGLAHALDRHSRRIPLALGRPRRRRRCGDAAAAATPATSSRVITPSGAGRGDRRAGRRRGPSPACAPAAWPADGSAARGHRSGSGSARTAAGGRRAGRGGRPSPRRVAVSPPAWRAAVRPRAVADYAPALVLRPGARAVDRRGDRQPAAGSPGRRSRRSPPVSIAMIGVPDRRPSRPASTSSSATTPANGDGSSTARLGRLDLDEDLVDRRRCRRPRPSTSRSRPRSGPRRRRAGGTRACTLAPSRSVRSAPASDVAATRSTASSTRSRSGR